MDKKTPLLIVLLLVALGGGGFASYKFWSESEVLKEDVARLEEDKKSLSKKNRSLKSELDKAKERSQSILRDLDQAQAQLKSAQSETQRFRDKFNQVQEERQLLLSEIDKMREELSAKPDTTVVATAPKPQPKKITPASADEYWEDVVRRKAELESEREDLISKLRERDLLVRDLEANAKDFEIQLADLDRVKVELEAAIKFKERTMSILTKDLVKEREDRKVVLKEIDKLKTENISLIREHKFLSRIQGDLEGKLKASLDEKEILVRKVDEIETVLKDKALDIDSLQKQLVRSVSAAKDVMPSQAKAVALPPIVVKADQRPSKPVSTLEGKVMAVNEKEKFVIVDLGAANGVKPGDEFKVVKGGKNIATLKIIETRKDISACDITESSPTKRLKEGDTVQFSR